MKAQNIQALALIIFAALNLLFNTLVKQSTSFLDISERVFVLLWPVHSYTTILQAVLNSDTVFQSLFFGEAG
jgi:hypothetical protein